MTPEEKKNLKTVVQAVLDCNTALTEHLVGSVGFSAPSVFIGTAVAMRGIVSSLENEIRKHVSEEEFSTYKRELEEAEQTIQQLVYRLQNSGGTVH